MSPRKRNSPRSAATAASKSSCARSQPTKPPGCRPGRASPGRWRIRCLDLAPVADDARVRREALDACIAGERRDRDRVEPDERCAEAVPLGLHDSPAHAALEHGTRDDVEIVGEPVGLDLRGAAFGGTRVVDGSAVYSGEGEESVQRGRVVATGTSSASMNAWITARTVDLSSPANTRMPAWRQVSSGLRPIRPTMTTSTAVFTQREHLGQPVVPSARRLSGDS